MMDFVGPVSSDRRNMGSLTRPGKRLHSYGKSLFLMGKSTISMAIFNSYVSLPEGNII